MIREWVKCVSTLGMDVLIWAMSLRPAPPHPSGWYEQQRIAQDKDMEARRLQQEADEHTAVLRRLREEKGKS